MAASKSPTTPPTLREIARRAGVSHTTVSLSLRNHPSIPEATRERLRELADRLGYRSNVLVSALMSRVRLKQHKSGPEVVGFLTGGPTADDWKNHSASVGFTMARGSGPNNSACASNLSGSARAGQPPPRLAACCMRARFMGISSLPSPLRSTSTNSIGRA